ncbi:hypothetical protein CDD83_8963 [Cordyceps sp. RAO-2017]|nr:hypothetical protein CDD83_8963 [Cordyceps sp. RAO-2017]
MADDNSAAPRRHRHAPLVRTGTSAAPAATTGALIGRIESLLESMLGCLSRGDGMSLELATRRSARAHGGESRRQRISFPGRTPAEGQKFARVLLILQLSHDALVSGHILTKRQIFYQHQDLFDKQRVVDELVDDIALTLGINRDDLNIVASAKGLVSGKLAMQLHDGSVIDASHGDVGMPIPSMASISCVSCAALRWILVVEKDATFRTLVSSQYHETAAAGPGLLVTAKGYPDLVTRSFLQLMHDQHAELPILLLTDFDPYGLNIFRCYRFGADAIGHESATLNPGIRWLGIKTRHIHDFAGSSGLPVDGSTRLPLHHAASRLPISSTSCRDPTSLLTPRDRKFAVSTLAKVSARGAADDTELERLRRELQTMLMMNVKAEIQWLDDAGNLNEWLDESIGEMTSVETPMDVQ